MQPYILTSIAISRYCYFYLRTCIIIQIDAPISQIYFVMKFYMFRTVPLSIIRSLFTVHTTMVYVIQLSSRTRSCSKAV